MTNAQRLLKELVTLLRTKEVSDSGREFHPTYLTSCRTQHVIKLEKWAKEVDEELRQIEMLEKMTDFKGVGE